MGALCGAAGETFPQGFAGVREGPAGAIPTPPHAGVRGGAAAGCSSLAGCTTSAEDAMASLLCYVHPTTQGNVCERNAGGCAAHK